VTVAVGIDLGGTKILARAIDTTTGAAYGRAKLSTPTGGPDAVISALVAVVEELDAGDTQLLGVGVPGFVISGSVVVKCPNIRGWDKPVDLGARLGEALGRRVAVGNDVNCGALAEHRLGAGIGANNLLAVFVGTGVGGGLILDGRVVDGERGLVGEIGHVTVDPDGLACGCGGRGHLEAYAGRAGIERRARELAANGAPNLLVELVGAGTMKSRHLAAALEAGDEVTVRLLTEAIDALALVIGNVVTLLDLDRVVLGGGVVDRLGQPLVDRIASSPAFGGLDPSLCELHLAQRLDDAGVAGAALLAVDRFG
jgi:glucokinase